MWIEWVEKFKCGFPDALDGPRRIGRESEYIVVDKDGKGVDLKDFFEAFALSSGWEREYDTENTDLLVALKGPKFTLAREVGLSTLELIFPPARDLFEVERNLLEFSELVDAELGKLELNRIGFGILPKGMVGALTMTPKGRYITLEKALGDAWKVFSLSASEQTHLEVSRADAIELTNLANMLTPVFVALTANSNVLNGKVSETLSLREEMKASILSKENRHGDPYTTFSTFDVYLHSLKTKTFLFKKVNGKSELVNKSFVQCMMEDKLTYEDFLNHDHYVWHTARPRSQHGTVEVRPICQQPWQDRMVGTTLVLALLDNPKRTMDFLKEHMRILTKPDLRKELSASVNKKGLTHEIFTPEVRQALGDLMKENLQDRGFGEEKFLDPILNRLENQRNPSQLWMAELENCDVDDIVDRLRIK